MELNLSANSPVIQQALKDAGITPVTNNDPPKKAGTSRKVVPPVVNLGDKETEELIKQAEMPKVIPVSLTAAQHLLLCREASNRQIDTATHLQELVTEMLSKRLGKPTIGSANFMSIKDKVTSVTGSVSRA